MSYIDIFQWYTSILIRRSPGWRCVRHSYQLMFHRYNPPVRFREVGLTFHWRVQSLRHSKVLYSGFLWTVHTRSSCDGPFSERPLREYLPHSSVWGIHLHGYLGLRILLLEDWGLSKPLFWGYEGSLCFWGPRNGDIARAECMKPSNKTPVEVKPWKHCNSLGVDKSVTAWTFAGSICSCSWAVMKPRNDTEQDWKFLLVGAEIVFLTSF